MVVKLQGRADLCTSLNCLDNNEPLCVARVLISVEWDPSRVYSTMLNNGDFENFVSDNELTVVNFFAPWCHWCTRLVGEQQQFMATPQCPLSTLTSTSR